MDNKILKLLRKGLLTTSQEERNSIIKELNNYPSTKDRTYAIIGLKDLETTLEDLLSITEGKHYKYWIENNIKEQYDVSLIKEENVLNNLSASNNSEKVFIFDSFGDNKDLYVKVNLEEILNTEIGDRMYGSLSNAKSNKKIMQCIKLFDEELSTTDKNDILDSILLKTEKIMLKKNKKATKETFVKAINEQLSDAERKDFIALLISRAKSFYNSFGKQ